MKKKHVSAILITGANGGLGSQLVKTLQNTPDIELIIATDINPDIEKRYKVVENIRSYQMDVSSEDSIKKVKYQLEKHDILVKYLVNNAGVNSFFPISESTENLLDKILKVNFYGPILTTSIFLPDLIASKGRIIQISSDSVRLPTPFHPYPASKIAMEGFSVSMRRELKLLDIDLVLIRPGAINTDLTNKMKSINNPVADSNFLEYFKNFTQQAYKNIGKQSSPKDVATLVLKSLLAKKPKLIYTINKNKKISFFKIFPERYKDKLMVRFISG